MSEMMNGNVTSNEPVTKIGAGKLVLRALLFVVILVVLMMVGTRLFHPKNNREDFGMGEMKANGILAEPENTIQVITVGDSECALAFAPNVIEEAFGIVAYNCGTTGQYLYESYRYLRQAFESQQPKVVILETNTIYQECKLSNYLFSKVELAIPLFRYHDRWKDMRIEDLGPVEYTWTDDLRGYMHYTDVEPAPNPEYMIPSGDVRGIARWNRQCVKDIQALCEENGAQLILISSPSAKNWSYPNHNGIAALAAEMGLTYIDMNLMQDQLQIDWQVDTKDAGDHMNWTGAQKVSRWLAGYLSTLEVFSK